MMEMMENLVFLLTFSHHIMGWEGDIMLAGWLAAIFIVKYF